MWMGSNWHPSGLCEVPGSFQDRFLSLFFGLFLDAAGPPGALLADPGRPKGRQSPEKKRKEIGAGGHREPTEAGKMPIGPHPGQKCLQMGAWVGAWVPKLL